MKARKTLTLLLAALALTACKYDDSDLWEQVNQNTEDIAALKAWQAETNTNLQSLQTLLSTTDYITAVTPVTEAGVEVGYTISFLNSPAITVYHGQKGDKGDKGDAGAQGEQGPQGEQGEQGLQGAAGSTPQIGVTQAEDGNWYWTLNGGPLTDDQGNPIRANGTQGDKGDTGPTGPQGTAGTTPQIRINPTTHEWEISTDGGSDWTPTGETAKGEKGDKGDSLFKDVRVTDTEVTFTLADEDGTTTITLPRYTGLKLTFDTPTVRLGYGNTLTVTFTAEGSSEFTPDNLIIVTPDGWKASTPETRSMPGTGFRMTITAPGEAQLTAGTAVAEGDILLILDNGQGETTLGRIKADCKDTYLVLHEATAGALATAIGSRTDMLSITVTGGTLDESDWAAVVKNDDALLYLDLAGAAYTGTNKDNIVYRPEPSTLPLISAKLPQGITGLGNNAFNGCEDLVSITLPEGLTSIGEYAFCFCSVLTSITLPDELTSIGKYAFYECYALSSVNIPDGITSIEEYTFHSCRGLTTITLPSGLTSIGGFAFTACRALTTVTCQAEMPPTLGQAVFARCDALASIQVPAISVDNYQAAAGWSDHAALITAIP